MGKNKSRKCVISYLRCLECGREFPIPRRDCSAREKGHIKDIWCPFCRAERKFVENNDNEYYSKRFERSYDEVREQG